MRFRRLLMFSAAAVIVVAGDVCNAQGQSERLQNPGFDERVIHSTRLCRLMCGSALRFRPAFVMDSGLRPKKLGISQNADGSLARRSRAFRASDDLAANVLGKAHSQINVTLVTDEADAVLQILAKQKAHQSLSNADWQRLFSSEGYVRLKRREASLQRSFTDEEFKSFVLSDKLPQAAEALAKTLETWRKASVARAARRALDYLPKDAVIRAKIYPVIKPRENSFVFEVNTDPAIFLYLDPARTKAQFENTLAHELHHIGYGSRCPGQNVEAEIATRPQNVRDTLRFIGAFGEGFAMLAAAGGPDVHPHKFSPAEDRARWDRDMANFNNDLKQVEAFFRDILDGRLKGDERDKRGFSFFGVQGPWYTVGWKMAVLIEKTFGRKQLIDCMCDQRKLLATYNEAAQKQNRKAHEPLALWSSELIDALR